MKKFQLKIITFLHGFLSFSHPINQYAKCNMLRSVSSSFVGDPTLRLEITGPNNSVVLLTNCCVSNDSLMKSCALRRQFIRYAYLKLMESNKHTHFADIITLLYCQFPFWGQSCSVQLRKRLEQESCRKISVSPTLMSSW